jgi:hypothetical protein
MKHILNNLSEEEKNSIREQHKSGMKVMTENFNKLLNSKLGDVKPLNEQKYDSLKDELAKLKDDLKNQLSSDLWKDTDDLLGVYNKLLPYKGKKVSGVESKRYKQCDMDRMPMSALSYFNEIWSKRPLPNEYCMGDGVFDFIHRISQVGDNNFSGGTEKSKDGRYTTPQVKKMIIDLVEKQ